MNPEIVAIKRASGHTYVTIRVFIHDYSVTMPDLLWTASHGEPEIISDIRLEELTRGLFERAMANAGFHLHPFPEI